MLSARIQRNWRIIILTITICIMSIPAYAQYSGGTGEPNNPYQIGTVDDLMNLGETPNNYNKNFILIAEIDMSPNLPGRKVFEKAVIAANAGDTWGDFQEIPFTGVFDGNGHTISNLTIIGKNYLGLFGEVGSGAKILNTGVVNVSITSSGDCVGALVGKNFYGTLNGCYSSGTINGKKSSGGLVGLNSHGYIIRCHSTCTVIDSGELAYIGGLVGYNSYGTIAQCFSTGTIGNAFSSRRLVYAYVGGLVGFNSYGTVTQCYCTGAVRGNYETGGLVGTDSFGKITNSYSIGEVTKTKNTELSHVGGLIGTCLRSYVSQCYSTSKVSGLYVEALVGQLNFGIVDACFWDIQTSGQTASSTGGIGKTTDEMQTKSTFTDAGWDLVGETENDTEGIWRICEDYPKLTWQMQAGDFVCPDGITLDDFDFFMDHWGDTDCNQNNGYCHGTDLNFSGTVDIDDYVILQNLWLAQNP